MSEVDQPRPLDHAQVIEHLAMILSKHGVTDYRFFVQDPMTKELLIINVGNIPLPMSAVPSDFKQGPAIEIVKH